MKTKMRMNGKPVVDATKKVVLRITGSDVRHGSTKDPATCAAALACKRKLHAKSVQVHLGRTYVEYGNRWVRFRTAGALRSEIIAFDRGGKFEPGLYNLMPVPPQDRFGHKRKKLEGPHLTKRKKSHSYHITADVRARGPHLGSN